MTATPLRLNLATRPVRNRRIFQWMAGALAVGLAVSAAAGGYLFVRFTVEGRRARREAASLADRTREAQGKTVALARETGNAERDLGGDVDVLNAAIRRKVFSWTRLLGEIEAALPAESVLVSFQPGQADDRGLALKIDIASANLEGLLAFLRGLEAGRFSTIRMENETTGAGGRLVSSLTLRYDQNR
jgi:hypothetical protein